VAENKRKRLFIYCRHSKKGKKRRQTINTKISNISSILKTFLAYPHSLKTFKKANDSVFFLILKGMSREFQLGVIKFSFGF